MSFHAESFRVETRGRQLREITSEVQAIVARSGVTRGLCNVFIHHTSASLIIGENADPAVLRDLERFAARLVPDGDPLFEHTDEGPDDMPAHVRTVLTQVSLGVPIRRGRADLGTWQGIFVWEHRSMPHARIVTISVVGDSE